MQLTIYMLAGVGALTVLWWALMLVCWLFEEHAMRAEMRRAAQAYDFPGDSPICDSKRSS